MNSSIRCAAHLACLLLLAAGTAAIPRPVLPFQDREGKALELLESAEAEVVRGRYDRAVRAYRKLAETYPDTPAGRVAVERSRPSAYLGSVPLLTQGPSSNRVDIALMGDGFQLKQQDAFDELAEDIPTVMERLEPFGEYFSYFNFRRLNLVSKDGGVDGFGREEDTALGGRTRGTIQGHVDVDTELVYAALDQLEEHDGLAIVFVRTGVLGTGYPGIAAIGGSDPRLLLHEWGHSFGRLGDEYSTKTHDRGEVPRLPNVARSEELDEVPWAHWIRAGAAGIGTYEGANGQVRDAWRPTASGCIMGDGEFFCMPCREELVLRIYALVDPIEATSLPPYPFEHSASLDIEEDFEFEVQVMRPASHALEVRWWILPEAEAVATPSGGRNARGPLPAIERRPDEFSRVSKTGLHRLRVRARELDPGRYRVVCRAKDTTELRGERYPWVLRDDRGLLESERAWWIRVAER